MDIFTVLLGIVICLLGYLWYENSQERKRYPRAGPTALPLIGNLHQVAIAGNIVKFLEENRIKYGNIYTIVIGGTYRVVVSGKAVFNELLVKNAAHTSLRNSASLTGKSRSEQIASEGRTGILWSGYPVWKDLRTFALNVLRGEGMGKQSLEPKINEECEKYMCTYIEPFLNQPVDVAEGFGLATSNIISAMLFGSRFDYSDPTFINLVKGVQTLTANGVKTALTKNLPLVQYWPDAITGMRRSSKIVDTLLYPAMRKIVEEHKTTLNRESPRDFVDKFLIAIDEEKLSEGKSNSFKESQLPGIALQLYAAGTETTAKALTWALLYTCKYPSMQVKVREEIEDQIGFDRQPLYKDRLHMPYTDSVLTETLRIGNIAPTALPHTLDKQLVIEDQVLPAGTELMLNMISCLNDEELFPDPTSFKPERFMGTGGAKKADSIPFGLGRRMCLGESLARTELFLFYTSILQKYKVYAPEGAKLSTESDVGTTSGPKPFRVVFSRIGETA